MKRITSVLRMAGAWLVRTALVGTVAFALRADTASGTELTFDLPAGPERPDSVAFSSDLGCLATATRSGRVAVWDLSARRPVAGWDLESLDPAEPNPVPIQQRRLVFVAGTRRLLVAHGRDLTLYAATNGTVVLRLEPADHPLTAVAVSADGRRAAGVAGRSMVFWDLVSGRRLTGLPTRAGIGVPRPRRTPFGLGRQSAGIPASNCMALSADGREFAVDKAFEEIDLWNLDDGSWAGYRTGVSGGPVSSSHDANDLAYLPGGGLAAIFLEADLVLYPSAGDVVLTLLRQSRSEEPQRLELHCLGVSGDGRYLAAGGLLAGARRGMDPSITVHDVPRDAQLRLWNTQTRAEVGRLTGRAGEVFGVVALDADGRKLAAVSGIGFARRFTGTLQKHARPPGPAVAPPGSPLRVTLWECPE
jgi:WD40 repeat protein